METTALQRALLALGYRLPKYGADGDFGAETKAALKDFQRDRGLAATGAVDAATLAALQARPVRGAAVISFDQPRAGRAIGEIIVHCTATPEGRDVSVATIRGWHIGQGWKDIGYHWIVLLDGTIRPGRPEAQIGSHVAGHNTGTLGVVYVGGVAADGKTPKDTRTPAQRAALTAIVQALLARYPTIRKISGHNQYAAKACPSFDVRKDALGRLI